MPDGKPRLAAALDAAAALRDAGDYSAARAALDRLAADPEAGLLGEMTALGLPRRLQAAMLRLAKAEGDVLRRIGYQYSLVPPPERLARFARFGPEERRRINAANRLAVPKVIHQIWIGPLPVPPACAAWAAHARVQGYDYRLWREADLAAIGLDDDAVFRGMRARDDYPGAVDAARYAVLAREGGIYLDCDWYPARDDVGFHDLLPMTGLCAVAEEIPRDTGRGALLLANSFIAVPPEHPVIRRLTEVLGEVTALMPKAPAWWSTGPLIFTLLARGGAVTLAGAGIVAGTLRPGASVADLAAMRAQAEAGGEGLLIAWKSW